jgi:hypothetical protein
MYIHTYAHACMQTPKYLCSPARSVTSPGTSQWPTCALCVRNDREDLHSRMHAPLFTMAFKQASFVAERCINGDNMHTKGMAGHNMHTAWACTCRNITYMHMHGMIRIRVSHSVTKLALAGGTIAGPHAPDRQVQGTDSQVAGTLHATCTPHTHCTPHL